MAIIGRQNVGKSTLLNRLTGRRLAIVADQPGTTRDRIIADIEWQNRRFTLVDTGGLVTGSIEGFDEVVNQQVKQAAAEADLVLFLADAVDGLTPADLEVADWLRKTSRPLLVVVNKADNARRENLAVEFFNLGMGEPAVVSAYHGLGIYDLLDRIIDLLPEGGQEEESISDVLKLALVGRPNVGKSMLLNRLLGYERVIVSQVPGTTRDSIDTVLNLEEGPVVLIDTAGIKRRGRIGRGVDKYSVIRSIRAIDRADIALLLLDAVEPATAQDTHIAGYIQQAGKGVILVVNKWDLISGVEQAEFNRHISQIFKFLPYTSVCYVSAKTGKGIDRLIPEARQIQQERQKRITTGELNGFVQRAMASHPPPASARKTLKILYATQADIGPPTFVFFVNDVKMVHFSYRRYLENRLRQAYGFKGTPIRMVFKNRGEA